MISVAKVKLFLFFLDTSKNMLHQATIHSMLNIDLDTLNGDSYLYELGVDSFKFSLLINLLDKHNIKYNKNHILEYKVSDLKHLLETRLIGISMTRREKISIVSHCCTCIRFLTTWSAVGSIN